MKTSSGFSLIELMIAIVVVGILAAIGYPSFQEHVQTTKRAECAGGLVSLAGAMERHFTRNNTYLGAGASGANTGAPDASVHTAQCPIDGGTATYNLTIQAATASTFEVRAAPTGAQSGDKCGTLTLSNTGLKGINGADTGVTAQDCW